MKMDNLLERLIDSNIVEETRATIVEETRATIVEETRATIVEETRATIVEETRATIVEETRATIVEETRATARVRPYNDTVGPVACHCRGVPLRSPWQCRPGTRYPILALFILLAFLLGACGGNNTSGAQTATPTATRVNGFGTASNHVHSLLALPNHVLLLATHYGTYRSENDGASWTEVSGGPNQLMQGLMDYSLSVSPLDPQRLFVLTQVSVNPHAGTPGLYTSADQGRTWKLSIPTTSLTSHTIYTLAPGNDTPDEVYIYLRDLGALGLKVSLDDGQHFSSTGTLPFGDIASILAIPGAPGQLLVCSTSDGIARSTDGGIHWQVLSGINGGVSSFATAGPHSPIYASGEAGTYASHDGGKTFTLVNTQASYGSLNVSSTQTQVLYGRTGTAIYRSLNGGRTWSTLPHISGNLAELAVDPANASQVYLSLSYPTEVYRFSQDNAATWSSLTPKP